MEKGAICKNCGHKIVLTERGYYRHRFYGKHEWQSSLSGQECKHKMQSKAGTILATHICGCEKPEPAGERWKASINIKVN